MKPNMSAMNDPADPLRLASTIVSSYVGHNTLKAEDIPSLLSSVYTAITDISEGNTAKTTNRTPAVPIEKSITPDHIICLEDGKKLKMLKRYLRTHYDLSPEDYRRKWRLPADYPMTAPNYAKSRSRLAKEIGLGTSATTGRRKTAKKSKSAAGAKRRAR